MRYTEGPSEWSPGPDVHQVSPPRKNSNKVVLIIVGAVLLLCCGLGIPVLAGALDNDSPRSVGGQVEVPGPDVSSTPSPKVRKPVSAPVTIGEGQWIVGEDVQAGRYKTSGADPDLFTLCVWTLYKTEGGDVLDFGTSGEQNAPGRATLKKGNAFHTTGCKPWVRQSS